MSTSPIFVFFALWLAVILFVNVYLLYRWARASGDGVQRRRRFVLAAVATVVLGLFYYVLARLAGTIVS